MKFKQLKRSRIDLVRKTYLKVVDQDKNYYLIEKAYASEYDGFIVTDEITEEEFFKAVDNEERIEEINFSEARLNIRNAIKRIA
ncbi:hypothetical protein [Tissierella sp.]|uniref:hypothetical protein n=1 Tax=Tissierella sp. TaxID=41274 RepID=UPI002855E529|nr:hypothetical protein [Tissierella sp.]MDR7856332.1 hypothetical protein [Tissierella sp.]